MYERYHELLELCFKAKEKGIDIFFDYSPHVEWVTVQIYKDKWSTKNFEPYKIFRIYISEEWADNKEVGRDVALEAIAYINGLLEVEDV